MGQSRRSSAIEATVNILVGYWLAVGAQYIVFPFFGIAVSISTSLYIGLFFTILSLVRSYVLRRMFNYWTTKWKTT